MTISAVVGPVDIAGSGTVTLAFTTLSEGDLLLFSFSAPADANDAAVSGGGVTTWQRVASYLDTQWDIYMDLWMGVVTTPGASEITVAGSYSSSFNTLWAEEFEESEAGWEWSLAAASPAAGSSGAQLGSGTDVAYPELTPSGASDYLYAGFAWSVFGSMDAGSTAGYAYDTPASSARQVCFSLAASGPQAPMSTQTNTGAYDAIGVIIGSGPAASPPPAAGLLVSVFP